MPAQMRIDQAGLPLGAAGFARTDGLDTGALVTLTNVGIRFKGVSSLVRAPNEWLQASETRSLLPAMR